MKIILMGGCGLLGSYLAAELKTDGHEVYRQSRGQCVDLEIDPFNEGLIKKVLSRIQPDIVVNLIAKTDVDGCEAAVDDAFLVNTKSVEVLAGSLFGSNSKLLHISTDQVYTASGFQAEDEAIPQNIYSLTKYAGELAALKHGGLVLRTNFICGAVEGDGQGLCNWLYRSLSGQVPIKIFEDVFFNPVHPSYLARLIPHLINKSLTGVYNVGSVGGVSKAELARRICEVFSFNTGNMESMSSVDFAFKAKRPNDMRMDITKLAGVSGQAPPTIDETIERLMDDF